MDEYISREELIKHLDKCRLDPLFDPDMARMCFAIGVYVENMKAADVQPAPKWISVKDGLPDESCECLGVVDGEVMEVSYSPKQRGYICVWSMCDADGFKPLSDDDVTHWMPMPEPPQD